MSCMTDTFILCIHTPLAEEDLREARTSKERYIRRKMSFFSKLRSKKVNLPPLAPNYFCHSAIFAFEITSWHFSYPFLAQHLFGHCICSQLSGTLIFLSTIPSVCIYMQYLYFVIACTILNWSEKTVLLKTCLEIYWYLNLTLQ